MCGKIKSLVISRIENLWTKINIQQISKKRYLVIKSCITNFMYVDEIKIKIGDITNIFLWL